MNIILIALLVILFYCVPAYYFVKWQTEGEIKDAGYSTYGQVLITLFVAAVPLVNILLFLVIGISDEKILTKRIY